MALAGGQRVGRAAAQDLEERAASPVHVGVGLADVAGDGRELDEGAHGQVAVPVAVGALGAAQAAGRLGDVEVGQLHDVLGRDLADLAGSLGRPGLERLDKQLVAGLHGHGRTVNLDLELAVEGGAVGHDASLGHVGVELNRRIGGLVLSRDGSNGHGRAGSLVPHQVVLAVHDVHLGLDVYQEGKVGVVADVVLVNMALVDDALHHGKNHRGVGAGADRNPPVSLGGGAGETRVDHDELGAGFLGVKDEVHVLHVGLSVVAAEHDDALGALHVLPLVGLLHDVERGKVRQVHGQVAHDAEVGDLGGVEGVRHHVAVLLMAHAVVAGHAEERVRLGAVGVHVVLHLLVDELESLIPGDALELAGAALAHTLHGVLHAVGGVNALHGVGDAAQADALVCRIGVLGGLDLLDDVVLHVRLDAAAADAVGGAHRAGGLIVGYLTCGKVELLGQGVGRGGLVGLGGGHEHLGNGSGQTRGGSCLEELATTKLQLAVHVVGALNHKDPSLFNELMANKGAPTVCSPQVKGKMRRKHPGGGMHHRCMLAGLPASMAFHWRKSPCRPSLSQKNTALDGHMAQVCGKSKKSERAGTTGAGRGRAGARERGGGNARQNERGAGGNTLRGAGCG